MSVRVAYLTTAYPSVSHTFIKRELLQMEKMLGDVGRFAIRHTPHDIVDPEDMRENDKTFRALAQSPTRWAKAVLRKGLARPLHAARGLRKTLEPHGLENMVQTVRGSGYRFSAAM